MVPQKQQAHKLPFSQPTLRISENGQVKLLRPSKRCVPGPLYSRKHLAFNSSCPTPTTVRLCSARYRADREIVAKDEDTRWRCISKTPTINPISILYIPTLPTLNLQTHPSRIRNPQKFPSRIRACTHR